MTSRIQRRSAFLSVLSLFATIAILTTTKANATVTGFVIRTGSTLNLSGSTFRFAGTNIYWLGLDEAYGVAYPSTFRVDNALGTAAEMGATVVRSHMCASVGNSLSIEPTLGSFNETALQKVDYAIKVAGDKGIRLILPLVDNYHYYHGGKYNFTQWRSISDENQFFSNSTVINDYKQYISTILNRVNTYTGVAYKNDPTILAWETGNEMPYSAAETTWTSTIATYIKSIDTNHLVVDGTYGVKSDHLTIANVDIVSDHYYPMNTTLLASDASAAVNANKAFYVGEYGWTPGDLPGFINAVQGNSGVSGDLYWSLFSHADSYGYVPHNDGFTMHYPGDDSTMSTSAQQLRSHAYAMRNQSVPSHGTPPQPLITSVSTNGLVAWRGAVGAAKYQLERAASTSGPWTTVTTAATDNSTPWSDASHPVGTYYYRVKGANLSGAYGAYSAVSAGVALNNQRIDQFNDWNQVFAKSANWTMDTGNKDYFLGDTSRAMRTALSAETLTYNKNNITAFSVRVFNNNNQAFTLTFATSPDNVNWTTAPVTATGTTSTGGNWTYMDISNSGTLPSGTKYLRLTLGGTTGNSWSPQLSQLSLNYN